ncbi:GntR family transcriptional regulator [Anaerotignum sp.]|uniref:GntR family transcriptional regulator n=1 Tax=Anaerotignum sp. TaxID=2039241 RepID=UPI0028A768DC|nr:GntR family transcriptional regulator [Anaerotignum sp.]
MELNGQRPEDYIYYYIRQQIIARELYPGNKIVEEQLAAETGISRTPIRAALKRLSYEGLLVSYPMKGSFVAMPTKKDMQDAYECRKLLEAEATRCACYHITEEELEELEKIFKQQILVHEAHDMHAFLEINEKFHLVIAKASRNSFFQKYIQELTVRCNVFLLFYDKFQVTPLEDSFAIREHKVIIDALRQRDPEKCYKAAIEHNQSTLDQLNEDKI